MRLIKYHPANVWDRYMRTINRPVNMAFKIALVIIPLSVFVIWLLLYPGAKEMVDNIHPLVQVGISSALLLVFGFWALVKTRK